MKRFIAFLFAILLVTVVSAFNVDKRQTAVISDDVVTLVQTNVSDVTITPLFALNAGSIEKESTILFVHNSEFFPGQQLETTKAEETSYYWDIWYSSRNSDQTTEASYNRREECRKYPLTS